MGDVEDPPEVEDQSGNLGGGEDEEVEEESMYVPSGRKARAFSVFRQVFCCCSVISFSWQCFTFELLGDRMHSKNKPAYYPVMIYYIGGCTGLLCGAIVWCTMGSKCAVVVSNILNLLVAAMAYTLYDTMENFRYAQHIVGFVHMFSQISANIYIVEVTDNTFRAFFVGLWVLIYDWMTYKYEAAADRRFLHGSAVALGVGSTVCSVLVPQAPFWVASKGDSQKARSIFRWLRADHSGGDAEYELMLEKAQRSADLTKKLTSSTFVMCTTFCVILDFCFHSGCDLHRVLALDYYIPKKSAGLSAKYIKQLMNKFYPALDEYVLKYRAHGALLYQVLCLVLPRKILYSSGIVFTLLLAMPLVTLADFDQLLKVVPFCEMIGRLGRLQSVYLLPLEIFPAILRPLGVTISYIIYRIFIVWRLKTFAVDKRPDYKTYVTDESDKLELPQALFLPFEWVYWNYSISIIAIPFLLLYMPETMGKNLYELEEVKPPFTRASSQLDSAEETVDEE